MTVKVPRRFTFTRLPVFGCAGEPGATPVPDTLREGVESVTATKLHVAMSDSQWRVDACRCIYLASLFGCRVWVDSADDVAASRRDVMVAAPSFRVATPAPVPA